MLRDSVFSLSSLYRLSPFKYTRYRLKTCTPNGHIKGQVLGVYIGVAMGTGRVLVLDDN